VFNLRNLNLWHNTLLGAVLIISTTSVLNDFAYTQFWLWLPLALALLLVLGGLGILKARKLPKMTIQPPKVNITVLLNFAFRFNQTYPTRVNLYIKVEGKEESKVD
jgi:predicted small integral membrane protein